MPFVALALVLPILALPAMVRSSDAGAAWILRAGVIEPVELQRAARRVLRIVFVAPLLALTLTGYALCGAPWGAVLAHVVTLANHCRTECVGRSGPAGREVHLNHA